MDTNTINTLATNDQTAVRRDSRDWRNVAPAHKVRRKTARRQGTKQAALQAYYREGGYR